MFIVAEQLYVAVERSYTRTVCICEVKQKSVTHGSVLHGNQASNEIERSKSK